MRKLDSEVRPNFAGVGTMTIGKAAESRFSGARRFRDPCRTTSGKLGLLEVSAARRKPPGKPSVGTSATDRAEKRKTPPPEINNLGYFFHSTFRG
jgi:hypothetical protein